MGIILSFLKGPLGMYALIAAGVLLLGAIGTAAYEHQRAARYQEQVKSRERDVLIALGAAKSKDVTIEVQRGALQKWVDWSAVLTAKEQAAVQKSQQDAYAALLVRQKLQELEKADYAIPDCLAYLAIDVARVCVGHARSLRERAFSYDR